MKKNKSFMTTTFQISKKLHENMKILCIREKVSMGCFVRSAIIDKIIYFEKKND